MGAQESKQQSVGVQKQAIPNFPYYCKTDPLITPEILAIAKDSFKRVLNKTDGNGYDEAKERDERVVSPSAYFFTVFYDNLFKECAECRPLFKSSIHAQGVMLMNMIKVSLNLLEDGAGCEAMLADLAKRHCTKYKVPPRYYQYVGSSLMEALKTCLGSEYKLPVQAAWIEIYSFFMINMLPIVHRWERKHGEISPLPSRKQSNASSINVKTSRSVSVDSGVESPPIGRKRVSHGSNLSVASTGSGGTCPFAASMGSVNEKDFDDADSDCVSVSASSSVSQQGKPSKLEFRPENYLYSIENEI
eukprot:Colp12_sorted_trinity150504_noHs@21742